MPHIYVDNDACPVKEEVLKVAARYSLAVTLVSNQGMRPVRQANVRMVTVGAGFDAADDWIAEHTETGDIIVTADIPLAARCLKKGASALSHNGKIFTPENIGSVMAMRELNAYLREAGESKGYNAAFTKADRSAFLQALDTLIQKQKMG
jgi:uncharacterized protein YaiI (UPF0178 family)